VAASACCERDDPVGSTEAARGDGEGDQRAGAGKRGDRARRCGGGEEAAERECSAHGARARGPEKHADRRRPRVLVDAAVVLGELGLQCGDLRRNLGSAEPGHCFQPRFQRGTTNRQRGLAEKKEPAYQRPFPVCAEEDSNLHPVSLDQAFNLADESVAASGPQ
jgi:hypothetical protein